MQPRILALATLWTLAGSAGAQSAAPAGPATQAPPAEIPLRWPRGRARLAYEAPPATPPAAPHGPAALPVDLPAEPRYLHPATGEVHVEAVDLFVPGRGLHFQHARKYRSRASRTVPVTGVIWDFSYNIRAEWVQPAEGTLVLHDGNTRQDLFVRRPDGRFVAEQIFASGELLPGGEWVLTYPDGGTWKFLPLDGSPAAGCIQEIADRNGNTMLFQYDGAGLLDTVIDTLGRAYDYEHDAEGRLLWVEDFDGRRVTYDYYQDGDAGGSAGDLKSVTTPPIVGTVTGNDFPSGRTTTYTYTKGFADERLNHNLLTVTDAKGQTFLTAVYDSTFDPSHVFFDRVVTLTVGAPGQSYQLDYQRVVPSGANGGASLIVGLQDRNGFAHELHYDAYNRLVRAVDFTAGLHPGEPAEYATTWCWNWDSLPTRVVHPEGNVDNLVYAASVDPAGPERSRGNLRVLVRDPGPLGGDQPLLVEQFEYDDAGGGATGHNFVTRHVDARGSETVHDYDARGNRIQVTKPSAGTSETFTYNVFGQLETHTFPDNGSGTQRVDAYAYFGPADGDKEGYLESVTEDVNAAACVTVFDVDKHGNVVLETDPQGNARSFVYNELDEVVRGTSPEVVAGGGVRYEVDTIYDANGNVVRVDRQNVDENGVVQVNTHLSTTYDHDVLNQVVRVTREVDAAKDVVTEYEYDGNQNMTLTRKGEAVGGGDPDNVVRLLYDERDLVYQRILAPGTPEEQVLYVNGTRNGNLHLLELYGRSHVFEYDGYDRMVRSVDPMGNVTDLEYDPNGNVTRRVVEAELVDQPGDAGNVRLYEEVRVYDAQDRLVTLAVEHFDAAGQPVGDGQSVRAFTYTDCSLVQAVTDDGGNLTTHVYDGKNRLVTVVDPLGNEKRYAYDCNDNVVRTESLEKSDLGDPDVLVTELLAYDGLDRRISVTTDLGLVTTWLYDSRDNRVLTTDAEGRQTRSVYDGLDRLVLTVEDMNGNGASAGDPVDVAYARAWDDSSRCTVLTDPQLNALVYAYDSLDRRVSVQYADGTSTSCAYDAWGNAVTCADQNGTVVQRVYDALDRVRQVTVLPGPGVSGATTQEVYDYDGLGRLVLGQDDDSLVLREYDSLSNITREVQDGLALLSVYDGDSDRATAVYPGGLALTFQYDALHRRKSVSDTLGLIYTDHYAGSRLEGRDLANGAAERRTFDADRRPVQVVHAASLPHPPVIVDLQYGVDGVGVYHTVLELIQFLETRTYTHDALDRLVQSTILPQAGPPQVTTYALDDAGNRTSVTGAQFPGPYFMGPLDAPVHQYTQTPSGPRQYDDAGNLVGGQVGPKQLQLVYDYRNQLVEAHDLGAGIRTDYAYDVLGRRIRKIVDVLGPAVETRYVYDGERVVEERDGGGAVLATWCPGALQNFLVMDRGGQRYFSHMDANGSVVALTDGSGAVVERYKYGDYGSCQVLDPAGNPLPATNVQWPYRFLGQRLDEETGLYFSSIPSNIPDPNVYGRNAFLPVLIGGRPDGGVADIQRGDWYRIDLLHTQVQYPYGLSRYDGREYPFWAASWQQDNDPYFAWSIGWITSLQWPFRLSSGVQLAPGLVEVTYGPRPASSTLPLRLDDSVVFNNGTCPGVAADTFWSGRVAIDPGTMATVAGTHSVCGYNVAESRLYWLSAPWVPVDTVRIVRSTHDAHWADEFLDFASRPPAPGLREWGKMMIVAGSLASQAEGHAAWGDPCPYDPPDAVTNFVAEGPVRFAGLGSRTRYYDATAGRYVTRDSAGPWGDPRSLGNAYTFAGNGAASLWASAPGSAAAGN